MSSLNRKILFFVDPCADHPQDKNYLKNVKAVPFPSYCTSMLQPYDQRIIRSFKHYFHNQLPEKTISVINYKSLHYATLMKIKCF